MISCGNPISLSRSRAQSYELSPSIVCSFVYSQSNKLWVFGGSRVTRWLAYYSIFGHLHHLKLAQWHTKFAKVSPRFFQIVKTLKKCPRLKILQKWQNFTKSGHNGRKLSPLNKNFISLFGPKLV